MSFSVEIISLILFCVQQMGIMLGVGAQSIMLIAYLVSARDGVIEAKEEKFGRLLDYVLKFGLFCIILSGLAITALHISIGQEATVESPAFIFKWLLITLISVIVIAMGKRPLLHAVWQGILGSQWYALFILHMVAPLAPWEDLLALYVLWTLGFLLLWNVFVYSMRMKNRPTPQPYAVPPPPINDKRPVIKSIPVVVPKAPPPPPPPPPLPKPMPPQTLSVVAAGASLPVVVETKTALSTPMMPPKKPEPAVLSVPQKPPPQKPIEDPDENPGLPTIRVMPQSIEQINQQSRPSVVQFSEGMPEK
jgi:hypothetical protein